MQLEKNTIAITGGSSGIGLELARVLSKITRHHQLGTTAAFRIAV